MHASNPTGGMAAAAAALDLSPVARLFADPWVTLLAWVHLLALDVLMARWGGGMRKREKPCKASGMQVGRGRGRELCVHATGRVGGLRKHWTL